MSRVRDIIEAAAQEYSEVLPGTVCCKSLQGSPTIDAFLENMTPAHLALMEAVVEASSAFAPDAPIAMPEPPRDETDTDAALLYLSEMLRVLYPLVDELSQKIAALIAYRRDNGLEATHA